MSHTFDWNHTFTSSDLIEFDHETFLCKFAAALRERFRLVGDYTGEFDFEWRSGVRGDGFRRVTPWAVFTRNYSSFIERSVSGSPYLLAGDGADEFASVVGAGFDGSFFEPAIAAFGAWRGSRTPSDTLSPSRVAFSFPFMQKAVTALSFYFVKPAQSFSGHTAAAMAAKVSNYAAKWLATDQTTWVVQGYDSYVPTDSANPRQSFIDYWASALQPPVLGLDAPSWPGPNGFTRKRYREITRLVCPGTNGQRARFVVCQAYRNPENHISGIASSGGYNIGYYAKSNPGHMTVDDPHWFTSPKPLVRDWQSAPLPGTPIEQELLSGKVMEYTSGAWRVSADQVTPPDVLTLHGLMQPGDLIGPWIFNELRDAINQLTTAAWPANRVLDDDTEPGHPTYHVEPVGVFGGSTQKRFYGFYKNVYDKHWGPRSVTYYQVDSTYNEDTGETTYSPLRSIGSLSARTACKLNKAVTIPGGDADHAYQFYAVVDWSASLTYKSGSNPSCPATWPAEVNCDSSSGGSSSGGSSSDGSAGSSSGGSSSGGGSSMGSSDSSSGGGSHSSSSHHSGSHGSGSHSSSSGGGGPGSNSNSSSTPSTTCTIAGCDATGEYITHNAFREDGKARIYYSAANNRCEFTIYEGPFQGTNKVSECDPPAAGMIDIGGCRSFTCSGGVITRIDFGPTFGVDNYWTRASGGGGGSSSGIIGSESGSDSGGGSSLVGDDSADGTGDDTYGDVEFESIAESPSGDWLDNYGNQGYWMAGYGQSLPSYVEAFTAGGTVYTWADPSTDDHRTLFYPDRSGARIAACHYDNTALTFDFYFNDNGVHHVAIYVLDYDSARGSVRFRAVNGALTPIISRTLPNTNGKGIWLVFRMQKEVHLTFDMPSSGNAVVSGVFFGVDLTDLP